MNNPKEQYFGLCDIKEVYGDEYVRVYNFILRKFLTIKKLRRKHTLSPIKHFTLTELYQRLGEDEGNRCTSKKSSKNTVEVKMVIKRRLKALIAHISKTEINI